MNQEPIKTIHMGRYVGHLYYDTSSEAPWEWGDMLGHIIHWHPRYILGHERVKRGYTPTKVMCLTALYLYDHSGLSLSTSPFSCPWDSGQVGWIYTTPDIIHKFGLPDITEDEIRKILAQEVEMVDQYLRGDVYRYIVLDEHGKGCESCSGMYGLDYAEGELQRALESAVRQEQRHDNECSMIMHV